MRSSILSLTLVSMFTFGFFAQAGDTTGALIECSAPAGGTISLDYSYLNIKDHGLTINIPRLTGEASLRQFWREGNQLLMSIRLDMPNGTRFLSFATQSTSVDPRGRVLYHGITRVTDTTGVLKKNIVMSCMETDGGGSW